MQLGLNNKVILVTGGASGIGEAIVRALAAENAVPVIVGNMPEAGERIAGELQQAGKAALNLSAELTRTEDCRNAVEKALATFGKIDGLVNNAGVNDSVGLERGSPEAFLASFHKNLAHYYAMTHFALPHLKKTAGAVVNIASKTAVTGQGNTSGYAAAKGGVLALTREWAVELLPYGIRVNAVVPSEVWTPLYDRWVSQFADPAAKRRDIEAKIPLGARMTTPEEIAHAVVFLLSDKAGHITGQHWYVDGGYVHLDRAVSTPVT